MVDRLAGKVAMVTGGASGLGREVVDLMSAEGAGVVIFDRNKELTNEAAEHFTSLNRRVLAFYGDVTSASDFDEAIATAERELGGFDIIHNNAAVQLEKPLHDTSEADYDWVMDINLRGVFLGCRAAVRAFRAGHRPGSIVNTTSIAAHAGDNAVCMYSGTKAAVLGMTRSIATGYAAEGIRANCVSPGDMDTPMLQKYFDATPDPAAARAEMAESYPCKRFAHPREVAQAVLFLASDEASFVSGECLIADGGLLASIY